jgi:hypothetical protein
MAVRTSTRLIAPLTMVVVVAGIWWLRRKPAEYSSAYVGDKSAVVWSTTAQVRQQLATLKYGDHVGVMKRSGDQAQVRTDKGIEGWVNARLLMEPALWQQSAALIAETKGMPVQAVGHTRAPVNLHVASGRDEPSIFQLGRGESLEIFERKSVAKPSAPASDQGDTPPDGEPAKDKQEDWLFVLRKQAASGASTDAGTITGMEGDVGSGPIAGWLLAQFVELDPPGPIADYTSSAGMRPVAWAVLNTVADPSGDKPQYLVAASRSGQAPECDFGGLRAYTWDAERKRYETAYVENNLCGQLPIRVSPAAGGAEFRFRETDEHGGERVYRLNQTVVRRVREAGTAQKKTR